MSVKPTLAEKKILEEIGQVSIEKGWVEDWPKKLKRRKTKIILATSLEECGPIISAMMNGGKAVLTAIRLKDGMIETVNAKESEKVKALVKKTKEKAEAAATVKRPTPCCPTCMEGAIKPATECLLSFLNEEEHDAWAKNRMIYVIGGITGHQYALAHRHSKWANQWGKICFDITDGGALHFHDSSVPPEEEILAAKLILENREDWLRNEATCIIGRFTHVLKNPFGNSGDGVADSSFTAGVGAALMLIPKKILENQSIKTDNY